MPEIEPAGQRQPEVAETTTKSSPTPPQKHSLGGCTIDVRPVEPPSSRRCIVSRRDTLVITTVASIATSIKQRFGVSPFVLPSVCLSACLSHLASDDGCVTVTAATRGPRRFRSPCARADIYTCPTTGEQQMNEMHVASANKAFRCLTVDYSNQRTL